MMVEQESRRQLVVIGAGPGGYAAAFHAADLGAAVTLIDQQKNPGGVCLYRGCIPSKILLHIAKVIADARYATDWGVDFAEPKIDLEKMRAWKTRVIELLSGGLGQLCKQRKIEFIQGLASFIDSNTLEVKSRRNGTDKIFFDHAILATGSLPATIPNIPNGLSAVMDSTDALGLTDIPESLLVIGGGYIGLELGSAYAGLGAKVTVVEMTSGLMPGTDPELTSILGKRLKKLFRQIMLNTTVTEIREQNGILKAVLRDQNGAETEHLFEKVLVSVGRKPNSAGLGLENTKVRLDERGFVKVDEKRLTDDPSIYAVGDVAGGPQLAHKASHEAMVAAKNIAGLDAAYEQPTIPFVIYTDPEIAECGLSESQAKKQNIPISVGKFPWAASGRAATMGKSDGLTKIILDAEGEKILGVGIVGAGAGELISEGTLAVEKQATAKDLAAAVHPHPTLSETLMDAAAVSLGECLNLYRPKRA